MSFLDNSLEHGFKQSSDFFLAGKTQLQVHLGKLWLAVAPQVFVTEATNNLIITLETSSHQQLLEHLWALWQRVELIFKDPTRNQEVSSSLRSGLGQIRRLDFQEVQSVQIFSNG